MRERHLLSLFKEGGGWQVIITAVALGENLQGNQMQPIEGTIAPKNMHIPILFPIYITVSQILDNALSEIKTLKSEQQSVSDSYHNEKNKSGWNKFWSGDNSGYYKSELEDVNKSIELNKDKIAKLKKDLVKMEDEFTSGCSIYFDGVRMRFKSA